MAGKVLPLFICQPPQLSKKQKTLGNCVVRLWNRILKSYIGVISKYIEWEFHAHKHIKWAYYWWCTYAAGHSNIIYDKLNLYVCGFGQNSELLPCRRRRRLVEGKNRTNRGRSFLESSQKPISLNLGWCEARRGQAIIHVARMNFANRRTWVQLHLIIIIMIMSHIASNNIHNAIGRAEWAANLRSCLERIARRDNAIDTRRKVGAVRWWHLQIHIFMWIARCVFDWRSSWLASNVGFRQCIQ